MTLDDIITGVKKETPNLIQMGVSGLSAVIAPHAPTIGYLMKEAVAPSLAFYDTISRLILRGFNYHQYAPGRVLHAAFGAIVAAHAFGDCYQSLSSLVDGNFIRAAANAVQSVGELMILNNIYESLVPQYGANPGDHVVSALNEAGSLPIIGALPQLLVYCARGGYNQLRKAIPKLPPI